MDKLKIDLYHGDCLEVMKTIPNGSVDMVLCDLPYGTVKGMVLDGWKQSSTYWDDRINTEQLFFQYERVLRMNGVAVLFSQEPYTSHLRTFEQPNLNFSYPLIWEKDHFANALSSKKSPVSYFEDLSVFHKKYDRENLHPLRTYFANILRFAKMNSSKDVNYKLGHRKAEHSFYIDSVQFTLCTEATYKELVERLGINKMTGFKTYEELCEINKKYNRVFNLPKGMKYLGNVLKFKKDYQGLHPTQKPVALLEQLIQTYTNEGDVVLDNCIGSGSTGVACVNTNRHFIGIEKDLGYFKIAKERINSSRRLPPPY